MVISPRWCPLRNADSMLLTSLGDRSFAGASDVWWDGVGAAGGRPASVPRWRGCRFTRPFLVRSGVDPDPGPAGGADLAAEPLVWPMSVRAGLYGAVEANVATETVFIGASG